MGAELIIFGVKRELCRNVRYLVRFEVGVEMSEEDLFVREKRFWTWEKRANQDFALKERRRISAVDVVYERGI